MADPLNAFDRILASLHRAALDDAHWPATAALIEDACGTTGNLLAVGEGTGEDGRIHFTRCFYRGEPREDLARLYFDVYFPRDEAMPRLLERPVGQLAHVPGLYTQKELRTSTAFNEGYRRVHCQNGLLVRLDRPDGLRIAWTLGDPAATRGWQSDQLRLIESVLPHVRQFVLVRQALAGAEALSAGLAGLLDNRRIGVVHLDREGRVLAANDPALGMLKRADGLIDRDGALRASLPADQSRLQSLLKRALPSLGNESPAGGSIMIQRPMLRSRLQLHVHPVEPTQADFGARRVAALALLVDPTSRPRINPVRVSALLGLTPSEGRVAALLAEGRPVREIAATAGFKESYVRFLLKQIYKKQSLSGQVALVQRVLSTYVLLRR